MEASTRAAPMSYFLTSVGKKVVMSLTGILLLCFVTFHLLGNIQFYGGPPLLDAYAHFLKSIPKVLWTLRGLMLLAVLLHMTMALLTTLQSWRARGQRYEVKRYLGSNIASRTMRWTGVLLGGYVVFHLLDLTIGLRAVHPGFDVHLVFNNVWASFSRPPVAVFYIVGMVVLGLHVFHGAWSLFQTLGLSHAKYNLWRRVLATLLSLALAVGYISIPVTVIVLAFTRR
jgi:succinate dehydrogenase / fumarate reductase, cytochrome b subunit